MDDHSSMTNLMVILCTGTVVAILFQRLRLAIIPAYLVAGMLVGPSLLGFVSSHEALAEISHLAVVLLLFSIGLELHVSALKHGFRRLLAAALLTCSLSIAVGWPVVMLFGLSAPQALAIAMAFSLSSTAVVLRLLARRRELARPHGQLTFAILVFQDLIVLGMFAALPMLARWQGAANDQLAGSSAVDDTLMHQSLVMGGGILLLVVLARVIVPLVMREAVRDSSGEIVLLGGLAFAACAAFIAHAVGFSLEMGAFLAGFILASSRFTHQLAGQIAPLRDLFMAVFFTSLGMQLDLPVVSQHWLTILAAVVTLLLVKGVVLPLGVWMAGISPRIAIIVGLSLAQAGEFSLVLIAKASELGLFNDVALSVAMATVIISLILTPSMVSLGHVLGEKAVHWPLAPWVKGHRWQVEEQQQTNTITTMRALGQHVVIGGFGPIGRYIAEELDHRGVSYKVIELNHETVARESQRGRDIIYGDLTNANVLEEAGLSLAREFVITFPDPHVAERAAFHAKQLAPGIHITARAGTVRDQQELNSSAVDTVVVDEHSTAMQMLDSIIGNDESTQTDITYTLFNRKITI